MPKRSVPLPPQCPTWPQHPPGYRRRLAGAAATLLCCLRGAFLALREAWWNLDRRTHVAEMLEREHKLLTASYDWAEATARTLEDIRSLPDAGEPHPAG